MSWTSFFLLWRTSIGSAIPTSLSWNVWKSYSDSIFAWCKTPLYRGHLNTWINPLVLVSIPIGWHQFEVCIAFTNSTKECFIYYFLPVLHVLLLYFFVTGITSIHCIRRFQEIPCRCKYLKPKFAIWIVIVTWNGRPSDYKCGSGEWWGSVVLGTGLLSVVEYSW